MPLTLVVLDGWGLSPEVNGNAILSTPTPNFDKLLSIFPYTSLHASSEEVGLSWGEMGNSEVGHLNLGTGRITMQDLPRIDKTIVDGTFFENKELIGAFKYATENNSDVHLLGLFSAGGVHSHLNHLLALLDLAKKHQFTRIFIHIITDGRDTPPKIIIQDLPKLEAKIAEVGFGKIASIMGRYYGMDRDKRWERTEKAYQVLTSDQAPKTADVKTAINQAYQAGKSDEFIEPMMIEGTPRIKKNDAVIFYNFRSDRVRQISDKIIDNLKDVYFVSFTSYGHEPTPLVKVGFFAEKVTNQLAMLLSNNKINQLHIAETEKYPHVTYFFNGGWEVPFAGEERILVPSPKVETYDLKPEMSALELTQKFTEYFTTKKPIFTVLNIANPDMVGHTGNMEATCSAVKTADSCLGQIAATILNSGGDLLVTADHGNAEQMVNSQTGEVDKEHTTNPVPLIIAFQNKKKPPLPIGQDTKIALAAGQPTGVLADITATIIQKLGLQKPLEITGQDLGEI